MKLIGLCGYKRAGKDTLADKLVSSHGFIKIAFAKPLKKSCKALFHFTNEQLEDETLKEQIDPRWGFSPRTALQKMGTEVFRNELPKHLPVGPVSIHIQSFRIWMQQRIKENPEVKIVITDVRFPDEEEFARSLDFKIIKITRENQVLPADVHESEKYIFSIRGDIEIMNNGIDKELYHQEIDSKLRGLLV